MNLTNHVHSIAEVTKAVTGGDWTKRITVDVRGETPVESTTTLSTPYTPYSYNYQAPQCRSTYRNPSSTSTTSSYYPVAQYGTKVQCSYPSYYQYQPSTSVQ